MVAENSFYVLMKKGEKLDCEVEYSFNNVTAPVSKGDVVGVATVYVKGVQQGTVNLIANTSVDKMNFIDYVKQIAGKWAV